MASDRDDDSERGTQRPRAARPPRQARPPVVLDLEATAVSEISAEAESANPSTAGAETPPDSSSPAETPPAEAAQPNRPGTSPETGAAAEIMPDRATPAESGRADRREQTVPPPDQPSRRAGGMALFAPALLGAAIALVVLLLLQSAGFWVSSDGSDQTDAIEALRGEVEALKAAEADRPQPADIAALATRVDALEALAQRLDAVEAAVGRLGTATAAAAAPPADSHTAERLAQLETDLGALRDAVASGSAAAGNSGTVDQAAALATLRQDIEALRQRLAALESQPAPGPDPGQQAAIEAARASLATLQGDVIGLAGRLDAFAANPPVNQAVTEAARAMAIGALANAANAGAPFGTELAIVTNLGLDGAGLDALRPVAETGVPTRATLAERFPAVAEAILAATDRPDENASWWDRLMSHASSLVTIRPVGPVAGTDPGAIVSRMQAAVDRGDLATALDERAALPPEGQAASAGWAELAGQRVALDRALTTLAEAGAAAPAASGERP